MEYAIYFRLLDIETSENSIRKTKCAITVEDHQITGGIDSAVAEFIAENRIDCAFKRMGFSDRLVTEYGWHKDILSQNGLSVSDIVVTVEELKGRISVKTILVTGTTGIHRMSIIMDKSTVSGSHLLMTCNFKKRCI